MKKYYISDRQSAGGFRALLDIIRDQFSLGIDMVQIREKDLPARALFEFTLAVLEARGRANTKVLVNSRADVALAARADGVHLPASAPDQVPPGLLVGRSCHTIEEVRAARADFVTLSPIFESRGKGPVIGLNALRSACQQGPPVYALGGITWENAESCIEAGAEGIAGIRLFQDPARLL
jgi:thiamine-phosphate pyrophosphorylase